MAVRVNEIQGFRHARLQGMGGAGPRGREAIQSGPNLLGKRRFFRHPADPPATTGFEYEMTSGSLFDAILDFPGGFNSPLTVSVAGVPLGAFGPGNSVDFVTLLGAGVSSFTISGLDPQVDSEDPLALPLQLEFDTATASFTMTRLPSLPEPAVPFLLATGIVGLALRARSARA